MFDYRVSQTDRGNGTGLGVRLTYMYWALAVGHGACRCRTIVHVKSEDASFTLLVITGCGDCGGGSGDCWMNGLNAPQQADC